MDKPIKSNYEVRVDTNDGLTYVDVPGIKQRKTITGRWMTDFGPIQFDHNKWPVIGEIPNCG